MLLRVFHETHYEYSPGVETAQHQIHLRPLANAPGQELLGHELRVWPRPDQRILGADVYGNARDFLALHHAHDTLRVVADSVVRTRESAESVFQGGPSWEAVRDRYRYKSMVVSDDAAEFVFPSPYVPRLDALATYARPSFAPGIALVTAAEDLMSRIHEDFTYETDSTDVNTPLAEALAQRKGVCQDFAHIMIGCLRAMGLPARYASGYLLTAPPPGMARLIGCDASHAWVQVYVPLDGGGPPAPAGAAQPAARLPEPSAEAAPSAPPVSPAPIAGDAPLARARGLWLDFDPTNNRRAAEDYVWLAIGRDFSDVSPMRGVLHGGAKHQLKVSVTVAPPDDPLWRQIDAPAPRLQPESQPSATAPLAAPLTAPLTAPDTQA